MMKKVLVSVLLYIIILNQAFSCFAFSDDFSFLEGEVIGTKPVKVPEPEPDDDSESEKPKPGKPKEEKEEEPEITITVDTSLEGVVFEDKDKVENIMSAGIVGTKYITNNQEKDSDEPGVSGVQVIDVQGDTESQVTTTGSGGNYSITESGNYNLKFKLPNSVTSNSLKYNGQDYTMIINGGGVESGTTVDLNYIRKIKEMEDSFTEIYILVDYSASMRKGEIGNRRLDVVKEAAIKFVNELYENADGNLAVGFIAFGYEAAIIKNPTTIEDDVVSAIRTFDVQEGIALYNGMAVIDWTSLNSEQTGTNIGGAADKARTSFLSSESSKAIVLFSDGAATAHQDVEPIYSDDSDAEVYTKLDKVAELTQIDLKEVIDEEITLISILNETTGVENDYVQKTFEDGAGGTIGEKYQLNFSNTQDIIDTLISDEDGSVKTIIEKGYKELLNYKEEKSFFGDEDTERRKEINEYYDNFYYENLEIFEVIEKILNGTATEEMITNYSEDLNEFVENTWIQSVTTGGIKIYQINYTDGKVSSITCGEEVVHTFEYYEKENEETGVTVQMCRVDGVEYKAKNVHIKETKLTLNAMYVKRDDFKLELDKKITGVRLTLSDGTVLYNEVSSNAYKTTEQNSKFKEMYCKQLQGASDIDIDMENLEIEEVIEYIPESVTLVVDLDLLQGATLEVEYTMIVKNNSGNATFSNALSIVDYFGSDVIYKADGELISEEGKNSDYGWKVLTGNELYEADPTINKGQYISEEVNNYCSEMYCLYANYTKEGYEQAENIPANGDVGGVYQADTRYINPVIGNNGQRYAKVVVSRVLSSEMLDEFIYKNQAEIVEYSNNDSRRINWIEYDEMAGTTDLCYAISGNYIPVNFPETISGLDRNDDEIDTAIANPVSLIPPTGNEKNKQLVVSFIIGISVVIVGLVTHIVYKRKKY